MEAKLDAEPRSETGKGAAHRLRASGRVPAVLYGQDVEPTPIHVGALDLLHLFHGGGGSSVRIPRSAVVGERARDGCGDLGSNGVEACGQGDEAQRDEEEGRVFRAEGQAERDAGDGRTRVSRGFVELQEGPQAQ